jgi:hypothetical protein
MIPGLRALPVGRRRRANRTGRVWRMAVMSADRAYASLLGLALGDALGSQFFVPANRAAFDSRTVPGASPEEPWQWTDDTEMACSVLLVLVRHGTIDQDVLAASFAVGRGDASTSRGRGGGDRRGGGGRRHDLRGRRWHRRRPDRGAGAARRLAEGLRAAAGMGLRGHSRGRFRFRKCSVRRQARSAASWTWNIGALRLWKAWPASSSMCNSTLGRPWTACSTRATRSRGM